MLCGLLETIGLGFLYFISAIPAGVTAGIPIGIAAMAAWCGYSAGGIVVLLAGAPVRKWLLDKLNLSPTPDPTKFFWRIWHRYGLWGLAFIAPVTIGPQATAAVALALGESPRRIQLAISLGVLPWVIVLGTLTALGAHAMK